MHRRAPRQCLRLRRAVQPARPLRRAHGVARGLRRRRWRWRTRAAPAPAARLKPVPGAEPLFSFARQPPQALCGACYASGLKRETRRWPTPPCSNNSPPPERCASPWRSRPRRRRNSRSRMATRFKGVAVTLGQALAKKLGVPGDDPAAQRFGRDPELGRRQQMGRRLPAGRRRAQEVRRLRQRLSSACRARSWSRPAPGSPRSPTPTPRASASAASPTPRPSAPPPRRRRTPRTSNSRRSTPPQRPCSKATSQAIALSRESLGGLVEEDSRRAHPRRRLPQLLDRRLRAEGPPRGAGLCQRVHRGGESLRPCAPRARRDGADRLADRAGRHEALTVKMSQSNERPRKPVPKLADYPHRVNEIVRYRRSRSAGPRQQRGIRDLFRDRPRRHVPRARSRHRHSQCQLRAGAAGNRFPARTALAGRSRDRQRASFRSAAPRSRWRRRSFEARSARRPAAR